MFTSRVRHATLALATMLVVAACVTPEPDALPGPAFTTRGSGAIARPVGTTLLDRTWTGGLSYVHTDAGYAEELWQQLGKPRDVFCHSCEARRYELTDDLQARMADSYSRMCFVAVVFGPGFERSPYAMRELAAAGDRDTPRMIVLLRGRARTPAIPASAHVLDATRLSAADAADSVRLQATRAGCGPMIQASTRR